MLIKMQINCFTKINSFKAYFIAVAIKIIVITTTTNIIIIVAMV